MLSGKKVLLGVTGSIAAYKTTFLTRLLIRAGAEVKVILTPSARDFITPLTLSTLSRNPVYWEYTDKNDESGKWNNHVELALWADLMIIAPLTANTLAKMVQAEADNFLMGVYLSAKCPVYFAPAMDLDMYRHPGTQKNIKILQEYGHYFIPPGKGELASGLEGEGRMAEPEDIIFFIEEQIRRGLPLKGKKVMINAGPTYEPIDPVRFIGNRSSGKMGIALSEAAAEMGAEVHLVLGPTHLCPREKSIKVIRVETAAEMNTACQKLFPQMDISVLAAAVADYRPLKVSDKKIKKSGGGMEISMVENPDILAGLGEIKKPGQFLAGFALETDNGPENARKKLHKKKCDLIVLNSPSEKGSGFGFDTNVVTMIYRDGTEIQTELKYKSEIAREIFRFIHTVL